MAILELKQCPMPAESIQRFSWPSGCSRRMPRRHRSRPGPAFEMRVSCFPHQAVTLHEI